MASTVDILKSMNTAPSDVSQNEIMGQTLQKLASGFNPNARTAFTAVLEGLSKGAGIGLEAKGKKERLSKEEEKRVRLEAAMQQAVELQKQTEAKEQEFKAWERDKKTFDSQVGMVEKAAVTANEFYKAGDKQSALNTLNTSLQNEILQSSAARLKVPQAGKLATDIVQNPATGQTEVVLSNAVNPADTITIPMNILLGSQRAAQLDIMQQEAQAKKTQMDLAVQQAGQEQAVRQAAMSPEQLATQEGAIDAAKATAQQQAIAKFLASEQGQALTPEQRAELSGIDVTAEGRLEAKTASDRAKVGAMFNAMNNIDEIEQIIFNEAGEMNRGVLAAKDLNVPFSKGRELKALVLDTIDPILRTESGAAVPEQEVTRGIQRYVPTSLDTPETAKTKLRLLRNRVEAFNVALRGVDPANEEAMQEMIRKTFKEVIDQPIPSNDFEGVSNQDLVSQL